MLKIIYTITHYKNVLTSQLYHDLLKYYKGRDASVEADFDASTITIEVRDPELAAADLKNIKSCYGLASRLISGFVKTKVFIDDKEVV